MKHHVWSMPDLQWQGFRPVPYWLDTSKIWALPLTRKYDDGKANVPTTVGDVIALLRDKQLKPESLELGVLENEFIAADGSLKVTVKEPSFIRDLLRIILQMHSEGIGALEAVWYYFDHDNCRKDSQETYSFFVVAKDKIVRERIGLSDYSANGFDPTIFETHDYKSMIWEDEANWDEAVTHYWYRKFYSETRTGQLMALRPDKPQLFYYERTGPDAMSGIGVLQMSLLRIKLVLWVLVIISIINLVIHWK